MKTKKTGFSRKIVCFGILIHILSRDNRNTSAYVFITEIF